MKTLYIIRHAKSDWGNPDIHDSERPLNERGLKTAPEMGERLAQKNTDFDLIVSSSATRAQQTAGIIAQKVGYSKKDISINPDLYLAPDHEIETIVWALDNTLDTVAIFGHNPGFTDYINQFANELIPNVPTCAIATITFEVDAWEKITKQKVTCFDFDYPKNKP